MSSPDNQINRRFDNLTGDSYCIMPELIKRKCRNPDAYLDEQDLKDIAEAKEDTRQGHVYTTKELRARLGIQ